MVHDDQHNYINTLIQDEGLPEPFTETVERWYLPLAKRVTEAKAPSKVLMLGVQGTQGSGKSTLANFLKAIFENDYGLKTVSISLDDFYLTRAERTALAEEVHPLFITRGVPGTHDVSLAIETLNALKTLHPGESVDVPRFNKAVDDRYEKAQWSRVEDHVDVIIFEGWCVGCEPEDETALSPPVNDFEAKEDANGEWRAYANKMLSTHYQDLFNLLDKLIVLNAPSFECVFEWRMLQEEKLRQKLKNADAKATSHILSNEEIVRFVSHYERLTRHCLATLPERADWVLPLNKHHDILDLKIK